jgi:hypothetical protein
MEANLIVFDTTTVDRMVREVLMDFHVVEKLVPTILMNRDNQTIIVKVNSSKDNTNF